MSAIINCSRRSFLKSSALAGGGLILGVHIPRFLNSAQAAEQPGATVALNAFVRIGADETVTVVVNHSEMGQGPYTSIPMVVAEELDADWSKVRYEPAPVDPAYNHTLFGMQITGGSTSTWASRKNPLMRISEPRVDTGLELYWPHERLEKEVR